MRSATRSFLNTPVVFLLLRATSKAFLGCGLALSLQVSAQTGWRGTTTVPPSSGSTARVLTEPSAPAPLAPAPAPAASRLGEGSLQMFGVRLSTASREEMRQAIRREGLAVQREDEAFSEDIYEASNLMPGLLQLKFSYAREGQKLARVDYVFTTFSDNAHVGELMQRVENRFGRPQRVTGREESGPYHAVWRLPDQMEVFVGREWPEKTTYLKFFNVTVLGQAAADSERESLQPRQGKAQNMHALPFWVAR